MEALVTIILTTLNSERYIGRSIKSCLAQSHPNLELLIVDGGSQDGTLAIVAGYDDERIQLIHQPANSGKLPGAINLGMAQARGAFITWTQDDSWYDPQAIETMLAYLQQRPAVALVYCDYWDVDETGRRLRYQRVNSPDHRLDDDVVRQCFLFRREVYEKIGPQDTRYFPIHEVPWRLRLMQEFTAEPLHVALMDYMVHPHSLTGRIGGWQLQRLVEVALLAEGHITQAEQRRRLARIDLGEAFDQYVLQGQYRAFWRLLLSAGRRDWHKLMNRGVWKMMLFSLLPGRDAFRRRLLADWQTQEAARQQRWLTQT